MNGKGLTLAGLLSGFGQGFLGAMYRKQMRKEQEELTRRQNILQMAEFYFKMDPDQLSQLVADPTEFRNQVGRVLFEGTGKGKEAKAFEKMLGEFRIGLTEFNQEGRLQRGNIPAITPEARGPEPEQLIPPQWGQTGLPAQETFQTLEPGPFLTGFERGQVQEEQALRTGHIEQRVREDKIRALMQDPRVQAMSPDEQKRFFTGLHGVTLPAERQEQWHTVADPTSSTRRRRIDTSGLRLTMAYPEQKDQILALYPEAPSPTGGQPAMEQLSGTFKHPETGERTPIFWDRQQPELGYFTDVTNPAGSQITKLVAWSPEKEEEALLTNEQKMIIARAFASGQGSLAGIKAGDRADILNIVQEQQWAVLSSQQVQQIGQIEDAANLLLQLKDDLLKVVTAEGAWAIPEGWVIRLKRFFNVDPDATLAVNHPLAFLATLARASGERGVLTDQDVARAAMAIGQVGYDRASITALYDAVVANMRKRQNTIIQGANYLYRRDVPFQGFQPLPTNAPGQPRPGFRGRYHIDPNTGELVKEQ